MIAALGEDPTLAHRRRYRIRGINRTSLWRAWKEVRKEVKRSSVRDVVDYLDFDIDPDIWIDRILKRIDDGSYAPDAPVRFTTAKSKGFSRKMTLPQISDIVLYRAIADYMYKKLRRLECEHVYFERSQLPPEIRAAREDNQPLAPIWERIGESTSPYEPTTKKNYRAWLCYNQYRKHLIFEHVHPYIVTTDITNFFDSVLFSRVLSSFHEISAPPNMVGLLLFLLERLSIRDSFGESPRIGLPVDEFGCSRRLAHAILFPHDRRMVEQFGENAYVRWMDDQNVGVASYAEGLRALAFVGESLGQLHLTPNVTKSRILSLKEAAAHFHLNVNEQIDDLDRLLEDPKAKGLRKKLRAIWKDAKKAEGVGNWDKVLKRVYLCSARVNSRLLHNRSFDDILENPSLASRIADYMRCTSSVTEYLDWVRRVWRAKRQVYENVNRILVESLLRLEPNASEAQEIRTIASSILKGKSVVAQAVAAAAPLLILRYGDRRSLPLLKSCFEKEDPPADRPMVRATAFVYASYGLQEAKELRKAAGKSLRSDLGYVVHLNNVVLGYKEVPKRFSLRLDLGFDPLLNRPFVDMRKLLTARLLGLSSRQEINTHFRSS